MAFLLAASGLAQQEPPATKVAEPRWFEVPTAVYQARRVTAYEFSAAGYKYRIERTGLGTRSDGKSPAQSFDLHLSKGDVIQVFYYAEYAGDALLLFGATNGVYGAGFVTRIGGALPGIKWKQFIPAVNVGRGTIEGDVAYVSARNFIAKVNLRQGSYAWRHGGLGRGGVFLAFDPPQPDGERVVFREVRLLNRSPRSIEVEKASGRILSPAFLAQADPENQH
ncbi:MAG: hypothetical protein ACRD2K_03800 [Terriglobales bacterium]